jgi:hypothetical protein
MEERDELDAVRGALEEGWTIEGEVQYERERREAKKEKRKGRTELPPPSSSFRAPLDCVWVEVRSEWRNEVEGTKRGRDEAVAVVL